MARSFAELMREGRDGTARRRLARLAYAWNINERDDYFLAKKHRTTKLEEVGRGDTKTLLQPAIAEAMAKRVERDATKIIAAKKIEEEQIRFVTILHEVVEMDRRSVARSVKRMTEQLEELFYFARVFVFGAVELEIVNLAFVKDVVAKSKKMRRKIEVLERMTKDKFLEDGARVMVHAHLLVMSDVADGKFFEDLEKKAKSTWSGKHLVRFEELWKRHSLETNIAHIARYVTKCGNELFRLKAAQERDTLADDVAATKGGVDMRALTKSQLLFLDAIYFDLQNRNKGARVGASGAGRGHEFRKVAYGV